jgi:hypothetical protein
MKCVPEAPFPELRRTGREADHLSLYSAEVSKEWNCTSVPELSSRRGA